VPIEYARACRQLEKEMRALGTPERAQGEKRYLKSDLEFLGVTVSDIRGVIRRFSAEHPNLSHEEVVALAEELWRKPVFERRLAAVILLDTHAELLSPRDLKLIERRIRESKTWALVDVLAVHVVGSLVLRYPATVTVLDRWAQDDDFWVRRSALLAMLRPLKQGFDFGPFDGFASSMLHEKEFFIRKAIGWVLRETAKTRPDEVYEWLAPRTHLASGVTIREAVKYLDPNRRKRLLGAYKHRRAARN
jgi:3-methyladenine DNA glycosylase AlkD